MNRLPGHSQVLIVGAGPSGLMMAAQLLRFGIQPLIIDAGTAVSNHSKAVMVQARSLESLRQIGLDMIFKDQGNVIQNLVFHSEKETVSLDLFDLGKDKSHYPFILDLEQSKTEKILLDYLTAHACPVYWNSRITAVHQTDEGVQAVVKSDWGEENISCDWLIGADGISSKVRELLALPFRWGSHHHQFYLADVSFTQKIDAGTIQVFLKEEGFVICLPTGDHRARFTGVLPKNLRGRAGLNFSDLKPYLTYTIGLPLQEEKCDSFSVYNLYHGTAERLRVQRCFLIGDAGHVHSPAGGQGMNSGMLDAVNLAWKLAGLIKGEYTAGVLDSYSLERMSAAAELRKTSDRMFAMEVSASWFVKIFRNRILPALAPLLRKNRDFSQGIFPAISQTGINYRESRLSVHHSRMKKIVAGDRLPYLRLFDEKSGKETDLHDWCTKPGFVLLVIARLTKQDIFLIAKWIQQTYPFNLHFYYLPPSEKNSHVFDAFEMTEKQKRVVVVRPDLHIGYLNDVIDLELIATYLEEAIGWSRK